jgi:hypothetical protein
MSHWPGRTYGTFAMIQDHPILNLLKTVWGRVRWVGHGRKPLGTCLMRLGWGAGSVKTENRFYSNRRHHRRRHHHYSRRRRSSCRFHSCHFVNRSSRHSALARIASGCSGCALGIGPFTCAPPRRSVSWSTIASPRRPLCFELCVLGGVHRRLHDPRRFRWSWIGAVHSVPTVRRPGTKWW